MKKTINIIIGLMLSASLAMNVWLWEKPVEVRVEHHVDWITIRDTVPMMVESHLTGETMTVTAMVRPEADASGTAAGHQHATNHEPDKPAMELKPDTMVTVSIVGDSATVTLPVEQRVYEDSLYTAYVSGYRPRLDSINLRVPHTYTTVTRTVSKPAKRWAIGPTIGAGYGIVGKQPDVFVGVSLTWNILP